jgi:hypothetical protein
MLLLSAFGIELHQADIHPRLADAVHPYVQAGSFDRQAERWRGALSDTRFQTPVGPVALTRSIALDPCTRSRSSCCFSVPLALSCTRLIFTPGWLMRSTRGTVDAPQLLADITARALRWQELTIAQVNVKGDVKAHAASQCLWH